MAWYDNPAFGNWANILDYSDSTPSFGVKLSKKATYASQNEGWCKTCYDYFGRFTWVSLLSSEKKCKACGVDMSVMKILHI